MKRLVVRVEDDAILNLSRKQNRTETDMAVMYGVPLDSVIEDIKAEIKKNILDEPAENGTNAEMACYNSGLLTTLEIIDKHIKGD